MTRHLVSTMVIIWGGTLLICGNFGAPNPQFSSSYHQPLIYSHFQPSPVFHPQKDILSQYQQQLLGPYYRPSISPYYPSEPTDLGLNNARIVGGFPVPDGFIPFMAGLRIPDADGKLFGTCGGTLITPRHILTAAHCFPSEARPIGTTVIINNLQLSAKKISKTAVVRKVKAFKIHELFKFIVLPEDRGQVANGYDIALLTLDQDVTTVDPVKIAAWDQPSIDGKKSFATGWGLTKPTDENSDAIFLLGTVLTIMSNDAYNEIKFEDDPAIKATQVAAYHPFGGRGVCSGDSGGPLFIGNQKDGFLQVGITSYGASSNCGIGPNSPGVFTRVSRFFDWINTNTGGLFE